MTGFGSIHRALQLTPADAPTVSSPMTKAMRMILLISRKLLPAVADVNGASGTMLLFPPSVIGFPCSNQIRHVQQPICDACGFTSGEAYTPIMRTIGLPEL